LKVIISISALIEVDLAGNDPDMPPRCANCDVYFVTITLDKN
jgi:hypothetical protein